MAYDFHACIYIAGMDGNAIVCKFRNQIDAERICFALVGNVAEVKNAKVYDPTGKVVSEIEKRKPRNEHDKEPSKE